MIEETEEEKEAEKKTTAPSTSMKKEDKSAPPDVQNKEVEKPPQTSNASPVNTHSAGKASTTDSTEDEGELTVYTVKRGDTMQLIARKYDVSVEQILKWNLLKSIAVKPGQELYIYVRK